MSVVGPSKIRVEPQGVGWVILGCGEPLYFRSGAWAVHTARRLATAQALHGAVELLVADRSGRVAEHHYYPPPAAPEESRRSVLDRTD